MKRLLTTAYVISLIVVGTSLAQDKGTAATQSKEVQQETKATTGNKTAKTATDTVYGSIESYEPGKSIKVTVPGKLITTKSFDLDAKDTTVNAAPNLKIGEWVSVVAKTDSNGHKTITVKPSSEKHTSHVKANNQ